MVNYGDIYKLGNSYLMCGDSTKEEDLNKLLGGVKVDLILTDPPYGININKKGAIGNTGTAKRKYKSKEFKPMLNDDSIATAKKAYDTFENICDRQIIFGGNYFTDFLKFSPSRIIRDKRKSNELQSSFGDGEIAYVSFKTPIRIYHYISFGFIREGDTKKRYHSTQKPIKLFEDILRDFSKENNVIYDAFGGSGTTIIACEQTNRICYTMELDHYYCERIIQRYEETTNNKVVKIN